MARLEPHAMAGSLPTPAPAIPNGAPFDAPDPSPEPGERPDWPPWTAPLALLTGLVLALFGALLVDIPAAVLGAQLSGNLPPGLQIADTVVQDAAFVAAAVILAGWGGRTVRAWQFGLRPVGVGRAVLGVVVLYVGFFVFSIAWQVALNLHGKEKLLDQLGANRNALLLVSSAALTCVVAPIAEEFLFRGYMFTALRNWRGPWPAALITGVLFGAVHATSAPVAYLVPLAALGVGLCLLYWRTRSLYPCIAAHCVNNCIAFGSLENWDWQIAVLIACALAGIALLFTAARRRGLLDPPVALAGA
jgi:membrane protease YdiL (CAAX protease family)